MMGYSVSIWRNFIQDGERPAGRTARARALPKIILLLCYSGSEPWKGPTSLGDMMAPGAPELNFLNSSDFILRNYSGTLAPINWRRFSIFINSL